MRANLQQTPALASTWKCNSRAALPRDEGTGGRGARKVLVLSRTNVDERDRIEANLHRWRGNNVIRAIGNIAEHQDDQQRPEDGSERRPAPTGCVEESEERAARRRYGCELLLADRCWQTAHFTTRSPTMFGCTVQMKE